MAKFTDLSLTDEDRKNMSGEMVDADGDKYPWGLRLHFNEDSLSKLPSPLPPVGTEVELTIRGKVTEYSENEIEEGDTTQVRRSGSLQITAIAMPGRDDAATAAKMYPSQGEPK